MTNYIQLIQDLDRDLQILRDKWINADPKSKPRRMEFINRALDRRLELMKKRDAQG